MTSNLKVIDSIFPEYKSVQELPFEGVDTISGRFLGKRAFTRYEIAGVAGRKQRIVIKRKNGLVIPLGAMGLSPNLRIFMQVMRAHKIFGFNDGQKREKLFYEMVDNKLRGVLPKVLGMRETLGGWNTVLVAKEFKNDRAVRNEDLYRIIDLVTDFHARYDGKKEIVQRMKLNCYTPRDYRRSRKVLRALFDYYYDDNKWIYGSTLTKILAEFIEKIDCEYGEVMDRQTLTHNDFTPRNIAVNEQGVIIYDWELACYQNPEHDLVELLITALDEDSNKTQMEKLMTYFREQLEIKTRVKISDGKFARIMRFNALEYCVNRLAIYRSYSRKNRGGLVKRCEKNVRKILEVCV